MTFQNKISTKQMNSLGVIVISLIILGILKYNLKLGINLVMYLTLVLLGCSLISLFEESIKRYKILKAHDSEEYDSEGERKIADYFKAKSIKFYLHPQVKVPTKIWIFDNIFMKRTLEPDFFLPQYKLFVEYWGMLDKEEYKKKADLKKKAYFDNDIEFISLTPNNLLDKNKLDWDFTQKLLDLIRKREGNNLEWKK